jgi:superfamily I DNA/RNA helicase/mRNA-degrading endonuclease RelE of RelBE toxin-antitoxin system
MQTGTYEIAISKRFLRELNTRRAKHPQMRVHIDSFMELAFEPFSKEKRTEKLFDARSPERYSLRVNDNFRVIFDKLPPNRIIYRAIDDHQGSYRSSPRISRIDWENTQAFPVSLDTPKRIRTRTKDEVGLITPATVQPDDDALKHVVGHEENSSSEIFEDTDIEIAELPAPTQSTAQRAEILEKVEELSNDPCVFFDSASDFRKAMNGELDEWMLFLPEHHRQIVTQRFGGAARIFGASGTGKTCILLHRAVFLARNTGGEVIVLSFRLTLAGFLAGLVDRLCSDDKETRKRIRVVGLEEIAGEIARKTNTISVDEQKSLIGKAIQQVPFEPASLRRRLRGGKTIVEFAFNEIAQWVKGATNGDREDYDTFSFPNGKPALSEEEGDWIFAVLAAYERLKGNRSDLQDVLLLARGRLLKTAELRKVAVLVDEFQDLDLCALTFVKALVRSPENLFFAGDHRQRIYRSVPSFSKAGINILGRSREVTLNYRNSPEIYAVAEAIRRGMGHDPDNVDGSDGLVDFARPHSRKPAFRRFDERKQESRWVQEEIGQLIEGGTPEHNIAIISLNIEQTDELSNCESRLRIIKLDVEQVKRVTFFAKGYAKRMTIHQAKGFEFPIVFIVGLSEDVFSETYATAGVGDDGEFVRALLYVAVTRARDTLYMSSSGEPLRLLTELKPGLLS